MEKSFESNLWLYNPRSLQFSGGIIKSKPFDFWATDSVVLAHYCKNIPKTIIKPFCYWSEAFTTDPKIAGEATGIFDDECIFRIEWKIVFDKSIDEKIAMLNKRFSQVGCFFEYRNLKEISLSECAISKIEDKLNYL